MTDLTAVSLFAGIGGFDLAMERAGVKVTAAVEIDPACRGVLRRHFPQARIFNDVTEVAGEQLRAAGFVPGRGVFCFGWPCQGNSDAAAGRRKGMDDPRSGLWRHVVRLVAEARPRWLLGENVPGLLSVNGGCDFGTVIRDLDDLGYGVAWRVLDAQFFGVPQRRRRVFLAGGLGDPCGPVEVLLEPEGGGRDPAAGGAARAGATRAPDGGADGPRTVGTLGTSGPGGGWRVGSDEAAAGQLIASTLQGGGRRGHRVDAEGAAGGHLVAPTLTAGNATGDGVRPPGRRAEDDVNLIAFDAAQITSGENRVNPKPGDPNPPLVATGQPMIARPAAVRRLTPVECERLQGFPDDWTRWLDDGTEQSDSARYRQCGNAIAVPVAEWIAQRVTAVDQAAAAEDAA